MSGAEQHSFLQGASPAALKCFFGASEVVSGLRTPEEVRRALVLLGREHAVEAHFRSGALLPTAGSISSGRYEVVIPLSDEPAGPTVEHLVLQGAVLEEAPRSLWERLGLRVGAALRAARGMVELEQKNKELTLVADVARLAAHPMESALPEVLAKIAHAVLADTVLLHLPDERADDLVLAAQYGLPPGALQSFERSPLPKGLLWCNSDEGIWRGGQEGDQVLVSTGGRFVVGAAIRLVQAGRFLGTLQLLRFNRAPFSDDALRLCWSLAALVVSMVEQRRLHGDALRKLSETRLLLDLARTTSGTLELSGILEVAADFLVRLLDASHCGILIFDERAQVLRGAAASLGHREFFRSLVVPLDGSSLAARSAREMKALWVEDMVREPQARVLSLVEGFQETALLCLPLTSREALLGVVVVGETRGPRVFSATLLELAGATVSQLSLSVANARLFASLKESYAVLDQTRAAMVQRERLAALGELSAIVAHEVRNPLGVIFNAVSSLKKLLPDKGQGQMLLEILGEESDRLNRIVGELLDFSRPTGPTILPEELSKVLQESLDAASLDPQARGVTYHLEVDPSLPPVPMDRRLIRQALVNVAVNAIQAMPTGGVLTVRALWDRRDGREAARVEVSDQGDGIPPDHLARIFEPFFTTKAKGTGLGLAVVKRIVEDHLGEVEVRSHVGAGTTFTLWLPLSPALTRSAS